MIPEYEVLEVIDGGPVGDGTYRLFCTREEDKKEVQRPVAVILDVHTFNDIRKMGYTHIQIPRGKWSYDLPLYRKLREAFNESSRTP